MPKAVQFTKGSIIYFEGDNDERIFILQRGLIVLTSIDIETKNPVTDYVKEGEFFGVKSAFGHFSREETATVVSDSVVVSITVEEFQKLFSSNKPLIMKMLKVFSNQLRTVHKKIESILNNKKDIDVQTGMASVAMCFYNDELYKCCCDVCTKYLELYPDSELKEKISKLYENAKSRMDKLAARGILFQPEMPITSSSSDFSLPAFSRFAKTFEPGSVIISEYEQPGETFYLIQSGAVQLVKCVNGYRKNLDLLQAGEFFGEMAILENSPRTATCIAMNKVEVLEFNKENFEMLITGNPRLALILLKLFCKRISDQKRRLKILVMSDNSAKIADVFVMFDEKMASVNPNDKVRRFNLTLQDIAHWTGLKIEVVKDELSHFVEKREIEMHDNYLIVSNIGEMKRIVDSKRL